MKVTKKQLIDFIAEYGDDYNTSMESIEFVGLDNVLQAIDLQYKPCTSTMFGAYAILEPETDPEEAMHDFFAESWGSIYDRAYLAQP